MQDRLTMLEVSRLTGLHKNTIRNYIRRGLLKAQLTGEGIGKQVWTVSRDDLYNCGIPSIMGRLGPQDIELRLHKTEATPLSVPDKYIEELLRVTRELVAAESELGTLRFQVPALQAAQTERDDLRANLTRLTKEKAVIEAELEQAKANAKWRWRRKQRS